MHISFIKLSYALYSPLCWILLKLKSVKNNGACFFCGFPVIRNDGSIHVGRHCRFMSKTTGNPIGLSHPCMLTASSNNSIIRIGDNCSFSGVSIWCFESIIIGNKVRVGANCLIMDGDAHQDDPRSGYNRPIVIEDNVWLGGNVVVKKGVTIGRNSVIGMNSVVTKDIPANCVAIGNPCVVVRQFDESKINEIENYFK